MPRVEVNGVHINYIEAGEGDTLLFVPGLIGLSKAWEFQFPYFSEAYRCLSFDHRGAGESDKVKEGYSTAQIAADVVALLDELGIEKAHVVGASTGGCILQNLCLDYPDRLISAIFTNTWTTIDEYYGRIQRLRKDAGLEITDRIELAVAGPDELRSAAREHADFMARETLANAVSVDGDVAEEDFPHVREVDIDGTAARIGLRTVDA